jgi:hypothetical protein
MRPCVRLLLPAWCTPCEAPDGTSPCICTLDKVLEENGKQVKNESKGSKTEMRSEGSVQIACQQTAS